MKKFFYCLLFLITVSNIKAQSLRTSIGIQGGISLLSQKISDGGESKILDQMQGSTFGLVLDQPLGKHFSFQTALSYAAKGSEERNYYNTYSEIVTYNLKYIELPVSLIMKTGKHNAGLFAGVGVAASYGVDASVTYNPSNGATEKTGIAFGNGEDDVFTPFDFGAYFQAGIEFRFGLVLSAHYYLGMSNIVNSNYSGSDEVSFQNRYAGITLGILFNNR